MYAYIYIYIYILCIHDLRKRTREVREALKTELSQCSLNLGPRSPRRFKLRGVREVSTPQQTQGRDFCVTHSVVPSGTRDSDLPQFKLIELV